MNSYLTHHLVDDAINILHYSGFNLITFKSVSPYKQKTTLENYEEIGTPAHTKLTPGVFRRAAAYRFS